MTGWRWLSSLVVLAGLTLLVWQSQFRAQAAGKDAPKTYEWKAFSGAPFYQVLTTTTNQNMKVGEMDVNQLQDQTFYIKWTPEKDKKKEKVKDKEVDHWVVTQEIIGVKMNIDIGGNKISFDSTEAQQPQNPMTDFFNALQKAKLKFYINTEDFSVTKIEDVEVFRKKLTETNPQMEALLKNILSDDALKQMAEPTWAAYPPKGLFPAKEAWTKVSNLDLGPIGIYEFTNKYSSAKDNPLKIDISSELKYKNPKKADGLPFIIKDGDLKTTTPGTGAAIFDSEKGWFKESTMDMDLKGTLKIEIGGTTTEVTVTQKQKSKVETMADDPIKAKKK
jgi:hypothetical protein